MNPTVVIAMDLSGRLDQDLLAFFEHSEASRVILQADGLLATFESISTAYSFVQRLIQEDRPRELVVLALQGELSDQSEAEHLLDSARQWGKGLGEPGLYVDPPCRDVFSNEHPHLIHAQLPFLPWHPRDIYRIGSYFSAPLVTLIREKHFAAPTPDEHHTPTASVAQVSTPNVPLDVVEIPLDKQPVHVAMPHISLPTRREPSVVWTYAAVALVLVALGAGLFIYDRALKRQAQAQDEQTRAQFAQELVESEALKAMRGPRKVFQPTPSVQERIESQNRARLTLISQPKGALVTLGDNPPLGRTPLSEVVVSTLEPLHLKFQKKGYRTKEMIVGVHAGENKVISVVLQKK